jgi:hypothetical protein
MTKDGIKNRFQTLPGALAVTKSMNNGDKILSDLGLYTLTMGATGLISQAVTNGTPRTVFGTSGAASCVLTADGIEFKDANGHQIGGLQPAGFSGAGVEGMVQQDNGTVVIYAGAGVGYPFYKPQPRLLGEYDALGKAIQHLKVEDEAALRAVESQYNVVRADLVKLLEPNGSHAHHSVFVNNASSNRECCIRVTTALNIGDTVTSCLGHAVMTMTSSGLVVSTVGTMRTVFGTNGAGSCVFGPNGITFWTGANGTGTQIGGVEPPGLSRVQAVYVYDDGTVAYYADGVIHPFISTKSRLLEEV